MATEIRDASQGRTRNDADLLISNFQRKLDRYQASQGDREEQARRDQAHAAETVRARFQAIQNTRAERDLAPGRCFEYLVLTVQPQDAQDRLQQVGSVGWELVSALPTADAAEHTLYLRRELATSREGTVVNRPGGGFIAAAYYESGLDADADGDVDGGVVDSIKELFE